MVYFQCERCNESLKRKAADFHGCRPRKLTCVDCSTTFGDDYTSHVTCVSEEEKYQGALFKKPVAAKRDPQAEWTEAVCKAAVSATKHKELLQRLVGYGNVPRKLKPFIAFVQNSLRIFKGGEELFAAILAVAPPRPGPTPPSAKGDADAGGAEAGAGAAAPAPVPVVAGAGLKRKREAEAAEAEGEAEAEGGWDMKAFVLAQLAKGRVKTKRLRKACVAAAVKASVSEEDAGSAFEKRLAKLVKKGTVRSVEEDKFVELLG
jgi:hypothetical protein